MVVKRFRVEVLIDFGKDVLVKAGFPEKQAQAAPMILVEADLRGDHAHGIAGGVSLAEYIERVYDDEGEIGVKRIEIADYSLGGIITIDMAATQRAVSPALEVARYNSQALNIKKSKDGVFYIKCGGADVRLSDIHLSVAKSRSQEEALKKLGIKDSIKLHAVEEGLLQGPEGEAIRFPLALDDVFKSKVWVAPLGSTYFGYKGFGLNMLIELDNVVGGGVPGLIRILDSRENPTTSERVSQTIEAYAIDVICSLEEAKENLRRAVETTLQCGNRLMYLPGQKEQEKRKEHLAQGIPMTIERVRLLKKTASDSRINIPFSLSPI
jgi:LDH2 family malate/lactate/ureidoglycolate dehydrogenase